MNSSLSFHPLAFSDMIRIVSPISIDSGSKNTAVLSAQNWNPAEGPTFTGSVLKLEDKLTLAQGSRTVKRHQRRGYSRRKMVKRLLRLILKEEFDYHFFDAPLTEQEFLNGLLNHRGFSYFTDEIDEAVINDLPTDWFVEHLGEHGQVFNTSDPIYTQLLRFSAEPHICRNLLNEVPFLSMDKRTLKKEFGKESIESIEQIKKMLTGIVESRQEGKLHRSEYFQNITSDLEATKEGRSICAQLQISATSLANLIGHLSNLQTRLLRRYFNDKSMQGEDLWKPERFRKQYRRYVWAWHAKEPQEKKNKRELLAALDQDQDTIKIFQQLDPNLSLPPYEDQNNRRPPVCQSLLLDAKKLDALDYTGWRDLVSKIGQSHVFYNYPVALRNDDTRLLQVALDRAKDAQNFDLRYLCFADSRDEKGFQHDGPICKEAYNLTPLNFDCLLKVGRRYFEECRIAAAGNWTARDSENILRLCGQHPPQKGKNRHNILNGLLRSNFSNSEEVSEFWNYCSETRIEGQRKRIKGVCSEAAKLQKSYGVSFNHVFLQQKEPELRTLKEQCDGAAVQLAGYFHNSDVNRYSSPYLLAQIFNLMETDLHGFGKDCRGCTEDNSWRAQIAESSAKAGTANAKRLPGDSVRPFDGMLARLLDRQAHEIAKMKIEELRPTLQADTEYFIPIIIEQNQFQFEEDLIQIKRNAELKPKKDIKKIQKAKAATQQIWQDKATRLRAANTLCPYTGEVIQNGEFDHIISRSSTRKSRISAAYNAEPNLIYCSSRGNNQKGDKFYSLENLAPAYLQECFATKDLAAIAHRIEENFNQIIQRDPLAFTHFHGLEPDEQKILRHALFVQSTCKEATRLLNQQNKTRVNGTQRYLCKLIGEKIYSYWQQHNLPGRPVVRAYPVSAENTSWMRDALALGLPEYTKQYPQPIYSHAVDAAMAFVTALDTTHLLADLGHIAQSGSMDLAAALPRQLSVRNLDRKKKSLKQQPWGQPIFKDTMYGDRFLPFLLFSDGTLKIGFSKNNSVAVSSEWFKWLQPFLLNKKRPVEGELCDWIPEQPGELVSFSIHADQAREYLHQVAKFPTDEDARLVADLLDAVSYVTERVNLDKALTDTGLKYQTQTKILDPKNYSVNFKLTGYKSLNAKGSIRLPAFADWKRFVERTEVQEKLGQKVKDVGELSLEFYKDTFLSNPNQNTRQHRKVRKQFALTRLPAGGSTLFRLKRRKPSDGYEWQLLTIDEPAYCGFKTSDGTILWNTPAIPKFLIESKGVYIRKGRYDVNSAAQICPFDKQLSLAFADLEQFGIQILMSPNSSSRPELTIEMPFEYFRKTILANIPDYKTVDHAQDIPSTIRTGGTLKLGDEAQGNMLYPHILQDSLLGQIPAARSNVFIVSVGDNIIFKYIAIGFSPALKSAYQAAYIAEQARQDA